MASDRFQAKYEELEQLSGMFSTQAGQVGETMGKLKQAIDNIEGKWIGEANKKYMDDWENSVLPGLNKLQNALNEGASRTKQMGQLIHDHEQQASNLFKAGAGLS
jgi:WXG100 family type VII secretion target